MWLLLNHGRYAAATHIHGGEASYVHVIEGALRAGRPKQGPDLFGGDIPIKRRAKTMNNTLLGFGIVFLVGAVLMVLGLTQRELTVKDLSVLVFFFPGVIALVAHLEIARLRKVGKP